MKKVLLLGLLMSVSCLTAGDHPDISGAVPEYKGAGSCVLCHSAGSSTDIEAIARDVVQTAHFQFKADIGEGNVFHHDGDSDLSNDVGQTGVRGKSNRFCGLPGSIAAVNWLGLMQNPAAPFNAANPVYTDGLPGGCARCHISNGTKTIGGLADDDAWETVDCLLCHATTYQVGGKVLTNYGGRMPVADAESPTGFHLPYISGADLATTSQSIVEKPTTQNCQNCHVFAGGGYTNKRGHDYDGAHGSGLVDHHSSKLSCVDCHITKNHKIGMGRVKPACWPSDLMGDEDNAKINCAFCHSTEGQAFYSDLTIPVPEHNSWGGDSKNKHMDNIACQTCHIKNNQGLDMKWFDQIVQEKDGDGNFKRWKPKGRKITGDAVLSYKWYNGSVYDNVTPRGEKGNGQIHPFRVLQAYVPFDEATHSILPVKLGILFNANPEITNMGSFGVTEGDQASLIERAIRIGVKKAAGAKPDEFGALLDGDGNYTGSYVYDWDIMNFSVDHGTNPASEARGCADCHAESGGILDWDALGYEANPYVMTGVETESGSIPSEFGLNQNYPNPFNPSTNIEYAIAKRGHVKLTVFDINGRELETLIDMEQAPGQYTLHMDAGSYSNGVYFYRLDTADFSDTKKFVLTK